MVIAQYSFFRSGSDGNSLCAELRVEEDAGVDDLLGEDEEVEGGGQVRLVSRLRQLEEGGVGVNERKSEIFLRC